MKSIFKKRLFLIFLMVFMFIPSIFILTSCGESGNKTQVTSKNPDVSFVGIEYVGNKQGLDNTGGTIQYTEGLSFSASEFKVVINYTDGTKKDVTSSITIKMYKLVNGTYVLANELLPGSYKAVIEYESLKGEYYFVVKGIELDETKVTTTLLDSYQFVPNTQLKPEFTISYNDTLLVENTDYTILYYGSNNTVGENTGSVYVQFLGLYEGSATFIFDITPISIDELVFNNQVVTYAPTNNYIDAHDYRDDFEINLVSNPIIGVDYIEYVYMLNNTQVYSVKDAGTYNVTAKIHPEDGYAPVADKTYTITVNPFDISTVDLSKYYPEGIHEEYCFHEYVPADFENDINMYMGNIPHTVTTSTGTNIDNENASTNTKHGGFDITATGSNYTGVLKLEFIIDAINASQLDVEIPYDYTYDGTEKTATSVRKYLYYDDQLDENVYYNLVEGTDYSISYSNNVYASNENDCAHCTITGLGNFTGSSTRDFYISKASVELDSELAFVTTVTTYNGTNQAGTLLSTSNLNKTIPEQLDVRFVDINDDTITDLTNANTGTGGSGMYVKALFEIKENLQNNYQLFGNNYIYDYIAIEPIVVGNTEIYAQETIDSFDGRDTIYEGTEWEEIIYYYTYDKEYHQPKVVIQTTVGGNAYTLVEGVDYTLTYVFFDGEYTDLDGGARNALAYDYYYYYVKVDYSVDETMNFATYKNAQQYYTEFGNTSETLRFTIKKLELSDDALGNQWPAVYRHIWAARAYLDETCENIYLYDIDVTVNGENAKATFGLVKQNVEDSYPLVNAEKKIYVECTLGNYTIANKLILSEFTNPFKTFKINGVQLTDAQIDDLGDLVFGNTFDIELKDEYVGYTVSYYRLHFQDFIQDGNGSHITGVVGNSLNPDYPGENQKKYNYEYSYYFAIKDNNDNTITTVRNNINRNIFDTFATYYKNNNDEWVIDIDYNYQGYSTYEYWPFYEGKKLAMIFKDGLEYRIDFEITRTGAEDPYNITGSIANYTFGATDQNIKITIKNANNDVLFEYIYEVLHS